MTSEPLEHLREELRRLDLLLHRQVLRLRVAYGLSLDEFRGLYISDEQVDNLVGQNLRAEGVAEGVAELSERAEEMRRACDATRDADLPWSRLIEEFELSAFERDVILLAAAPEFDLKYETVYAYLNNDVSRKWPTFDLALRLFSGGAAERARLLRHFLPESKLFRLGLLHMLPHAAERASSLARGFTPDSSLTQFLLGNGAAARSAFITLDETPAGWDEVLLDSARREKLRRLGKLFGRRGEKKGVPLVVFEGQYGSGRLTAARAVCRELGLSLLSVDLAAAKSAGESLAGLAREAVLLQRLNRAGIFLAHFETLFDGDDSHSSSLAAEVASAFAVGDLPVFLSCTPDASWRRTLEGLRSAGFSFDAPEYAERQRLWSELLRAEGAELPGLALELLASRFELTPGQIRDAVTAAADARSLAGDAGGLSLDLLTAAARGQSDRGLGRLAVKVTARHGWDNLVLPPTTLRQVKEVAAAIRHRHVVYEEWGFGERVVAGRGLKVLFAGASGTGKTMTAGVIARDLGLDLYRIDLAGVVSKYIGETEKNLDRIFRAARSSNAILFFDEADALFGKRSEVKDAHDRYANIEVAYLLQKMEEHEGAVVLASNLSKNMDAAFSRRMHYVVEFPMPDETYRERLWRGMFPPRAPLGADVDFKFLARQFDVTGGDIRNVALDAAFLAAEDGQVVTMRQLVRATARQMLKQGKVPSPSDFKQYHALIAQDK
ncbi:MAG TPA: ATP-binding protein [Pyrinomonadaceae bacterium]|nr:ATP-binding protein [Pyrinomonadaceae bacterium]